MPVFVEKTINLQNDSNIRISLLTVLTLYRDRSTIVLVTVLLNFFPFSDIFCHVRRGIVSAACGSGNV